MTFNILTRNDDAATWASVNPIPYEGQICLEMDTRRFKVGDGTTAYNDLPYWQQRPIIKFITGATYTITASDEFHLLICTNPGGCVVDLPETAAASIPMGFTCHVHQDAAAMVELQGETGNVALRTAISLKTRTQYSSLSIIAQSANTYKIIGDALYE